MKLKKVAALCNQSGVYRLFDRDPGNGEIEQWMGDGCAAYPITGLPYLDMDNICAMFDIGDKKREKMVMSHGKVPENLCFDDLAPGEVRVEDPKLRVCYEGREYLPLRMRNGIVMIREKYLTPLDDLEYMSLFVRRTEAGGVYVVAKIGMMVQAVIMPVEGLISEGFVERLEELTEQCRRTLIRKRGEEQETGPLFLVDQSTGEVLEEGGEGK